MIHIPRGVSAIRLFIFALVLLTALCVYASVLHAAESNATVPALISCDTLGKTSIEDVGGKGSRITRASEDQSEGAALLKARSHRASGFASACR